MRVLLVSVFLGAGAAGLLRAAARRRFVCQPPRLLLPGEGPPARWSVTLPLLAALAAGLLLLGGAP